MERIWIGFDIGGTKILSAYTDGTRLQGVCRCPTPRSAQELLDILTATAEKYCSLGVPCAGVGIGFAGAKLDSGALWAPNLPWLNDLNLERVLSCRLCAPVRCENDAHAALRGEMWQGVLREERCALLLSIGTGIGGAVLLDGNVLRGCHGVCGAAGWLRLRHEEPCRFEKLASGTALNALAQARHFPDSQALCRACREGIAPAQDAFRQWSDRLAQGIASLASFLDIGTVVLSGGLSEQYDLFCAGVSEGILRYASPLNRSLVLKKAALGELSCLYGAVKLAIGQEKDF